MSEVLFRRSNFAHKLILKTYLSRMYLAFFRQFRLLHFQKQTHKLLRIFEILPPSGPLWGGGLLVSWEWRFWQGGASVARGRRREGGGGGGGEEPGHQREAGWLEGRIWRRQRGSRLLQEKVKKLISSHFNRDYLFIGITSSTIIRGDQGSSKKR